MGTTAAGAGVRWVGAQRTVLAGDLRAHISLERLAGLPHLYALGPVAGLRGEITVVDGRPYVSQVEDGRIVVDPTFRHEAAFLVWAQIARWYDLDIPETVRDGRWVFIAGANDRLWQRLAAVIGLEHLVADPRFATNLDRVQHRAELEAEVEVAIARHDEDSLLALLAKADVPAVPVNTIDRVLSDPQCAAREMVERVPHPTLGEVPIVGVPVKFSEMRPRVRTHAPRLGEHTDEVLAEHGYSAAEIAELRACRIVA